MAKRSMKYDKARSGSSKGISASQWNGFLGMHKDYYNGNANNAPIPPILQNSVIANAVLKEGSDSIGAYQPVRITKSVNVANLNFNTTSYEVEPVNQSEGERHGNYAFTLSEGMGQEGGRIVVSGIALVQMDAGELYYNKVVSPSRGQHEGSFDSSYYVVPDETLSSDTKLIAPTGHFRLLSWYDPTEIGKFEETDKVYVALDMGQRPTSFRAKVDANIEAPTEASGIITMGSGTAYTYYGVSGSTAATGTMEVQKDEDAYKIEAYNASDGTVASGEHLLSYSLEYNRFIILAGGSTTFQIEMTQVGGEQGTSTDPASWTYDVKKWEGDGSILKAGVNPVESPSHYRRPNAGQLSTATYGTATYNSDGELVIIDCNETLIFTTC